MSLHPVLCAELSRPVKKAGPADNSGVNLPFEEALKKLEAIVEAMESDDLPLESLLAKYEEGTQLARLCQTRLSEAEVKIQQLEKSSTGQYHLKEVQLTSPRVEE